VETKNGFAFFALMGSAIALREKLPTVPHTPDSSVRLVEEIKKYANELDAIARMESYGAALQILEQNTENADYFLIELEPGGHKVTTKGFNRKELEAAEKEYSNLERKIRTDGGDAVLVSVASVSTLRRAYPNYFADTRLFIEAVHEATRLNASSMGQATRVA
jgi:hypothetical protein